MRYLEPRESHEACLHQVLKCKRYWLVLFLSVGSYLLLLLLLMFLIYIGSFCAFFKSFELSYTCTRACDIN